EFSEINVPVPSTPPSVTGSDLFYFIIALTIFTSVTIGAIARLTKITLQVKTPDDGEEDGKVEPETQP
ncbi:MAG: hypothetical protein F6K30_28405, partial [Cyanothece sp. SIO2G6]|nr:hypothetical protein [Cyanothece sp. SIO2G6]